MEQFIHNYGLLALFLWALIENDAVFIMTGVAIDIGLVHPLFGPLAAIGGSMLHDGFWFGLAHHRSDWIRSTAVYRRVGPYIERLAQRFGPWELFLCRFVYGTRNPSLIFWGVQRLPLPKFLLINLIGLSVWSGLLATLGYFLSDQAAALIGHVKRVEYWLLGALVLAVLFLGIERFLAKRQIKRRTRD